MTSGSNSLGVQKLGRVQTQRPNSRPTETGATTWLGTRRGPGKQTETAATAATLENSDPDHYRSSYLITTD